MCYQNIDECHTPFQNQTSKPKVFKALKATTYSLIWSTNDQNLKVYQNKGLSRDKCYGQQVLRGA